MVRCFSGTGNTEKDVRMEERIDSLDLKTLRIIQPARGYRFGMDSVLLADFASPGKNDRILDLGCGDGVLLFLLWGREPTCSGTGIEWREDACDRAKRSAVMNGLDGAFEIICGDLRKIRSYVHADAFSLCVCNPPYWREGSFRDDGARTQTNCTYGEIAAAAAFALRGKGRFCVICPSDNFDLMMAECVRNGFSLRRFRTVHSRPGLPGRRVLMEFAWRVNHGGAVALPPLYTCDPAGKAEMDRIYHGSDERKPK